MALFKLPKLQARLPIVDGQGNPMTSFLRFFNIDFVGAIERQEANQDALQAEIVAVQATQQAEIDRLNRVLAGTEEFTAVNVDGVIVAENGGLADGIVSTDSISPDAVTELDNSPPPVGDVDCNFTTPQVISTATATMAVGEQVEVFGNAVMVGSGQPMGLGAIAYFSLYRDGLLVQTNIAQFIVAGANTAGSAVISLIDNPGPGTYVYTTRGSTSSTADTLTLDARSGYASAKVFKR